MVTATLEAASIGTYDQWSLLAGANKIVAVNSPDDDATSYIQETTNGECESYYLATPPAMAELTTVTHRMRVKDPSGDADYCVFNGRLRITPNATVGTNRNSANSYTTYTEVLGRPGGGSWSPADLSSLQVEICFVSSSPPNTLQCTTLNVDIDYVPPAGGTFTFGFGLSWIPPLIAVASHCLSRAEIVSILKHCKERPSRDEEFAAIQAEFLRRPRFSFLGVH